MADEFARFMEACGGVEPLRLAVRSGGGRPVVVQFDKPAVVIGRDHGADLQLPDRSVAPRHLYLQLIGGRVFGVHLSDEATTRRGADAWTHGWVRPGDVFTVGDTRFGVINPIHQPDLSQPTGDPLTSDSGPGEGYFLEPLWDEARSAGLIHSRRALLLIGRYGPTRVQIDHPSVSPVHAALVHTPDGLWVVDLGSETGVKVNGVPVAAAPVGHRSWIGLGEAELRVHLTGDPRRPTGGSLVPRDDSRPAAADLAPVLEQVTAFQKQTFDQVRDLMGTMMQMLGTVMAEQRQFIRDEMDRMERMIANANQAPARPSLPPRPSVSATTPLSLPKLPPKPLADPPPTTPAPPAADVHAWLNQQLGNLEKERMSLWQRLVQTITAG